MSRGSPILTVRVSPELLAMVDDAIRRINARDLRGEIGRSQFVHLCIREQLKKMKRSRQSRRKPPVSP